MATKIITKNSSTATSIPTAGDLVQGELAVNVTDKRLFTEDSGGAIVELGTNPSTLTSGAATFSDNVTLLNTTADANLEVQTTFSGADARLNLYGHSTGTSQIRFGDEASVNVGLLTYNHADDSLTARVSGSDALTIDANGSLDIGLQSTVITGLRGARRLVLNGDGTEGVDFLAYASTNGIVDGQYIGGYLLGNDDNNGTEDHFAGMWANAEGTGGSMTLRFAAGRDNYENDTPQMIIDGLGNVGLGVTPSANLHVLSDTPDDTMGLLLEYNSGTPYYGRVRMRGNDMHIMADTTNTGGGFNIYVGTDLYTDTPKLRLDADGRCLFGTTDTSLYLNSAAPSGVLINGGGGEMQIASTSTGIYVNRYGSSGTAIDLRSNGGVAGTIYVTTNSASYNTSSDYRLKEDAVPMTGATERVKALRPINFAWKADGSRVDGFLAHEAQEVVPEAVHGTKDAMRDEEYEVTPAVEEVRDEDGNVTTEAVAAVMGTRSVPDYQGIDQSKLVPLLTATIQELIARIEALEGA